MRYKPLLCGVNIMGQININMKALFNYFYNDTDRFGEPRDVAEILNEMQCHSDIDDTRRLLRYMVNDGELIEESGLFRAAV